MKYIGIFDVIGPNMIGPSSSHTAGAVSIALLARKLFSGRIVKAEFILYGSFAKTGSGHGTDKALLGGILGFDTNDGRIRDAFAIADERGIQYHFSVGEDESVTHPNTADIFLEGEDGKCQSIRGESVGGGKVRIVRINDIDVDFTGEYNAVIIIQKDCPGVAAHITKALSDRGVNIAFMRLFRESKGERAYTIVESDGPLPQDITGTLLKNLNIQDVMLVQKQEEYKL